jgi:hypothetical protein
VTELLTGSNTATRWMEGCGSSRPSAVAAGGPDQPRPLAPSSGPTRKESLSRMMPAGRGKGETEAHVQMPHQVHKRPICGNTW